MNLVVVGLLIGLWTWVMLPGLLRERRNSSPRDSGDRFERDVDARAPSSDTGGREILVLSDPERVVTGGARHPAELRRRALLGRGGFLVAAAAIGGAVAGGWWWAPVAVVGPVYLLYVALVVRLERRLAQQREMLHDLAEERQRRLPPAPPTVDTEAIELVVGDESGIIVTGWNRTHPED